MPLLRSRDIPSPPSNKPGGLSNEPVVEPPTPVKTAESVSPSPPQPPSRRRSLRLSNTAPSPKRTRNHTVSPTIPLPLPSLRVSDDFGGNDVFSLRSGARVAKIVSIDDVTDNVVVNATDSVWVSDESIEQKVGSLRSGARVAKRGTISDSSDVADSRFYFDQKQDDCVSSSGDVKVCDGSIEKQVGGNDVLSLRSGVRVAKQGTIGGFGDVTGNGAVNPSSFDRNQDHSVSAKVRVSEAELDRLISRVIDKVKGIQQEFGGNNKVNEVNGFLSLRSGARVSRRVSIDGGNGDVVKEDVKEEGGGVLEGKGGVSGSSGRKRKTKSPGRYSREEKGKGTSSVGVQDVGNRAEDVVEGLRSPKRYTREDKGKGLMNMEDDHGVEDRMEEDEEDSLRSPRRYTREEKGKGVFSRDHDVIYVTDEGEAHVSTAVNLDFDLNVSDWGLNGNVEPAPGVDLGGEINEGNTNGRIDDYNVLRLQRMKETHKNIAKHIAHKYAHFTVEDDEGPATEEGDGLESEETEEVPPVDAVEDWPGPFSTAVKIIRDREKNLGKKDKKLSSEGGHPLISWTPKKERGSERKDLLVPSLQNLCLRILAKNVDAIGSLNYVPDVLRHKLCQMLCDSRNMNAHFFSLLLEGSPSEIRVADCSWLEEEEFESSIKACDTSNLTVLQLDLCGHCVSDASLLKAVANKGFPVLTTISLKGACRISDAGLKTIVSAAPVLRSMNLSQCSLLTDAGIKTIADSLGSIVHELYLDDCDTLNAMAILPSLQRLVRLEVLSLRGIGGVSDKFMKKLIISNGENIKELILANCVKLTNSSLKVIAETCSQLCVLDLSHLRKLTDIGLAYLANGCRGIQDLRLCRNKFSDDAIAAFLEASGKCLKELSLNNVTEVGQNTTISLARQCKNLESLDLSWCRSLTDEAMGLIADSCMSLRLLKIFGCTQITRTFIDGHSNPHLHVVGMKLTPILENIKRPDFQQGPLYYSAVPSF